MPAITRSPKRTKVPKYQQAAMLEATDFITAIIARDLGRPVEEIRQWRSARAMYHMAGVKPARLARV
jgi:hypothetical protein